MTVSLDLSQAERVPLAEAMGGARHAARVKLMGSSGWIPPRPMLWPCAGDMLNGMHDLNKVVAPDIDLLVVHRAVVGGRGAHLKLDDVLVYAEGPYPAYIKYWYDNDITPQAWDFRAPVRLSLPKAFVITHFNYVWGHWLTEMYPKLFLIRTLIDAGVVAPLLLPASAPAYMAKIARALIPDLEIVTYHPGRQAVAVGTVLLPHMLHKDYYFHDFLRWELEREALKQPRGGGFDKVFVSRSGVRTPQSFREMENEAEIEAIAEGLGLTLLRPETLSWEEQARIFFRARVVAGEFGSGLHNALLSPPGCQVVSLNWVVDVQSRIANFRRHDLGYILPEDGQARLYSIEPQKQPFRIDPEDFRRKLSIAVERADAGAEMAGWDDGPVLAAALRL
jgi:O-antigen biosynthesis protein WbqL